MQEKFKQYKEQGYTHVPVVKTIMADLDTPVSAYLKLANKAYTFLFESVQGGEKWGRYSIIGLQAKKIIKVCDHKIHIETPEGIVDVLSVADPFAFIEKFINDFRVPKIFDLPRFCGGLVGYFGYESARFFEKKIAALGNKPDPLAIPDILLMLVDEFIVFDNLKGVMTLVVHADLNDPLSDQNASDRLEVITALLQNQPANQHLALDFNPIKTTPLPAGAAGKIPFSSNFTEQEYCDIVEKIKGYILAGDVMQVLPSQRMSAPFSHSPLALYRALRMINPSPYMYILNLDDFHIVGSSPEILVRVDQGKITLRPIAGTRRRGKTKEEDLALEKELLNDPKEIAEHVMLIDLGRNDVGRIAQSGTVKLTDKMVVERYSHVMHIVSNVEGDLQEGLSALDVLKATFPAGTLTGAPKIHAMELLHQLEPIKRGVYGGAVGYLTWQGDLDTAIAIRTAVIKNNEIHVQAGAGIVADSIPHLEWKETLDKGQVLLSAAELLLV